MTIKRSAGTAYIDVALGNVDQVLADARAVGQEVDTELNAGVSDTGKNAGSQFVKDFGDATRGKLEAPGQDAGSQFTSGFTQKTNGLWLPVSQQIDKIKSTASKQGSDAAGEFTKGFKTGVGDLGKDALAKTETEAEGSGDTSGKSWTSRFLSAAGSAFTGLKSAFSKSEADAGSSGGKAGDNWGKSFFGDASNWFGKVQKKQSELGLGLTAAAFAPGGLAAGAGLLGGGLALGSTLAAPIAGAVGFGTLLSGDITSANTALTNISAAGGNQGQIASDISTQQSGLSSTAYAAQQTALSSLTSTQLSLVSALGDANTSYLTLSPAEQQQLANIKSGTAAYNALLPAQKQAVDSLVAQQAAYTAVTPAQQLFIQGITTVKGAWSNLQNVTARPIAAAFTAWIPLIQTGLTAVGPIVTAAAGAFANLGNVASQAAQSGTFQAVVDKITGALNGGAIEKIGSSLGDIADGFVHLFLTFGSSGGFLTNFEEMGEEFRQWATDQSAGGSFSKFLDYLKSNGATLITALTNIAHVLGNVGGATAGVGKVDLSAFTSVLGLIAKLPPSVAGPLAAVVTQLALFSKLGGFAGLGAVTGFFKDLSDSESGIRKFTSAIADGAGKVGGFFSSMASGVATGGSKFMSWAGDISSTGMTAFKNGLSTAGTAISDFGGKIGTMLSENGSAFMSWASSVGSSALSGLMSGLSTAGTAIANFATSIGSAVAAGAKWVAENALEVGSLIAEKAAAAGSAIADGLATVAQWLWDTAMDAFPLVLIIAALIALVAVIIKYHNDIWNFVVKIWDDIWDFLKQWWEVIVITVVTGGLYLIISLIEKYHTDIWNFIVSIWNKVSGFVSSIWDDIYNAVTGKAEDIYHGVMNTFSTLSNDVAGVFKEMANDGFVTPINWVIDHVLNQGIIGGINDVTGIVGIPKIPDVPDIPKFALGGLVPGTGSGDTVKAMLTPGEGVLTVDEINALGGAQGFMGLRQAIRSQSGTLAPQLPASGAQPDRNGTYNLGWSLNPINDIEQAAGDVASGASAAFGALKNAALGGLRSAFSAAVDPLVNSINPPPAFMTTMHAVASNIEGKVLSFLGAKDQTAAAVGGVIPTAGQKTLIAAALTAAGIAVNAANENDVATIVQHESGWNPNAQNNSDSNAAAGDPSRGLMQTIMTTFEQYRVKSLPDDIFNPEANLAAGSRYAVARYGSLGAVPGIVSLAKGGSYIGYHDGGMVYDTGGYLPPGLSTVYNGLGTPEPVLTPNQWSAVQGGGSGQPVNVTVNAFLDGQAIDVRAETVVENALNGLSDQLTSGRILTGANA